MSTIDNENEYNNNNGDQTHEEIFNNSNNRNYEYGRGKRTRNTGSVSGIRIGLSYNPF